MLLDTGGSQSGLGPEFRDILTGPVDVVSVQQFDRRIQRSVFLVPRFECDKYEVGPVRCFLSESGKAPWEFTGQLVHGVAGSNAFRSAVLQIDYQEQEVRILSGYDCDNDSASNIFITAECPEVMLDIGGIRLMFLDTGNAYGLSLKPAVVDRLVKSKAAIRLPTVTRLVQNPTHATFVLRELRLGDTTLCDVWGVEGAVNAIGNRVLSRFRVTIDYPKKKLYLKPRTDLPPRDPLFGGGVFFKRNEQRTFVRDLEIDRPAHQAGLQIDDRIIKVDGKVVEKMPFPELYDLLARHEVTVPIEFERDQKPQSVEVRLQQPLAWPPVWPEKKPLRKIPDE